MSNLPFIVVYLMWVLARLRALRKFWALPTYKGEDWFFGVKVSPDFYQGPGKRLRDQYHIWLLVPAIMIEAVCLWDAIYFHWEMSHLFYVQLPLVLAAIGARLFALRVFSKKGKAFEVEGGSTSSPVVLSLKPRQLSNYSNRTFEIILAAVNVTAILIVIFRYPGLAEHLPTHLNTSGEADEWMEKSFSIIFFGPLLLGYIQAGALLWKQGLVRWRIALPAQRTEEYLEWREEVLRIALRNCDWIRLSCTVVLVTYVLKLIFWNAWASRINMIGMAVMLSLAVLTVVYTLYLSRRLETITHGIRSIIGPKKIPLSTEAGRFSLGGLLYYNSDNPALFVETPVGPSYTLNLANKWAYVHVAYLAGLALMIIWVIQVI